MLVSGIFSKVVSQYCVKNNIYSSNKSINRFYLTDIKVIGLISTTHDISYWIF